MTPLVYTVAEVAQLLKLSRSAVYRSIKEGTIPVIQVGRSKRVLAWWVDERTGKAA
jgi:excisionase family DNA binding protein